MTPGASLYSSLGDELASRWLAKLEAQTYRIEECWTNPRDGMPMRLVPAGMLRTGGRATLIPAFYLSASTVGPAQWAQYAAAGGAPAAAPSAAGYCRWAGVRLPTPDELAWGAERMPELGLDADPLGESFRCASGAVTWRRCPAGAEDPPPPQPEIIPQT